MKNKIIFVCFFILCTKLFGNEIKIYTAATLDEINKNQPLLVIYFGEHAEFDSLSIKPGYFDERYFEKNNRIKKMNLKIFNCKNIEYNETIEFKDEMSDQTINLAKKVIATKIEIYVQDIFPGSKWNDLVISDINFLLNGTINKVSFDAGDCVYGSTYYEYEYDNQNRIIREHAQYGKAGADDKYYKYENGKIYKAYVGMDDDPNNLKYELIDSVDKPVSKNNELFYKDGKIIAEKYTRSNIFYIRQYLYEDNQLISIITISENSNWMDKFSKYFYNEKGLLIQTIGYEDATIYRDKYE